MLSTESSNNVKAINSPKHKPSCPWDVHILRAEIEGLQFRATEREAAVQRANREISELESKLDKIKKTAIRLTESISAGNPSTELVASQSELQRLIEDAEERIRTWVTERGKSERIAKATRQLIEGFDHKALAEIRDTERTLAEARALTD